MTTVLDPAHHQRMEALKRGNTIRLSGADALREISRTRPRAASMQKAAGLISAGRCDRIPLERVLMACWGIGHGKMRRLIVQINVTYGGRRVADLTPRQRRVLCEVLRAG